MKKIENKIMLITYADSMSKDLKELDEILYHAFSGSTSEDFTFSLSIPLPATEALPLSTMTL